MSTKRSAWPSFISLVKTAASALLLFEPGAHAGDTNYYSRPTHLGGAHLNPHVPQFDLPFGIEAEFLGLASEDAATLVHGAVGSRAESEASTHFRYDTWQVRPEMVQDDFGRAVAGTELVSPVLTSEDKPTVKLLARVLGDYGAAPCLGCGVHVHLDGRAFDTPALLRLTSLVYQFEDAIFRHFKVSSFRRFQYVQALDAHFTESVHAHLPTNAAEMRLAWYGAHTEDSPQELQRDHLGSRNRGLNLHAFFVRGTVELRYFEGTLHGLSLTAAIDFSRALGTWALQSHRPVTAADFAPHRKDAGGSIRDLYAILNLRLAG